MSKRWKWGRFKIENGINKRTKMAVTGNKSKLGEIKIWKKLGYHAYREKLLQKKNRAENQGLHRSI